MLFRSFGVRAGSELSMGFMFSWGVLVVTALVGGRSEVCGPRDIGWCEPGLILGSMAVNVLLEGTEPEGLEQEPIGSWVSSRHDGSLCLGWQHGCGPWDWRFTSELFWVSSLATGRVGT